MKKIVYPASERGVAELGWLHSRHSFSFGEYYNPDKMGFGLLRVLNDDTVEPGEGFGTHPHNNMEIISVVTEGLLEHKDSMGSGSVIKPGDVQVMSAGTGILHSEFNHSELDLVKFLQIWIIPKERGIKPRYDQKFFEPDELKNKITAVVSGENKNGELFIHQDAAISIGRFDSPEILQYEMRYKNNGAYLFVLKGNINLDGVKLGVRDAIGVYDTDKFDFEVSPSGEFIIIDVPMH